MFARKFEFLQKISKILLSSSHILFPYPPPTINKHIIILLYITKLFCDKQLKIHFQIIKQIDTSNPV